MEAASLGNAVLVRALIQSAADVDIRDTAGVRACLSRSATIVTAARRSQGKRR
jgi:hypothetical protein